MHKPCQTTRARKGFATIHGSGFAQARHSRRRRAGPGRPKSPQRGKMPRRATVGGAAGTDLLFRAKTPSAEMLAAKTLNRSPSAVRKGEI